jgi:hypothetical protein
VGFPKNWQTFSSPLIWPAVGAKLNCMTKILAWMCCFGFHPNLYQSLKSTPNNWSGGAWLQTKRALNLLSNNAPFIKKKSSEKELVIALRLLA